MNLEQTIKQMREKNEDDKKFYPLIESMKRRAAKGLLEGVKPEDIDFVVNNLNEEENKDENIFYLQKELFEINEAIDNYENLDNFSEDEVEQMIYEGFIGELNKYLLTEEEDKDNLGRAGTAGKIAGGIAGGTVGAVGAQHVYKLGTRQGWWPSMIERMKGAQSVGSASGLEKAAEIGSHGFGAMASGFDAGKAAAASEGLNGIVGGISGAATAAPLATAATAIGGGLALGAGIYGIIKLIRWLRNRRRQRQVSSFEVQEFLFTPKYDSSLSYIVNNLTDEEIAILKENACEDTLEIISMFRGRGESLNESVTFIDNAGNLKTMLTPDYVKDMHEYNTDTEIAKYKKEKNRDYKLISEEIDIDGIKKLSEMSFEDILNEDLFVDDSNI